MRPSSIYVQIATIFRHKDCLEMQSACRRTTLADPTGKGLVDESTAASSGKYLSSNIKYMERRVVPLYDYLNDGHC